MFYRINMKCGRAKKKKKCVGYYYYYYSHFRCCYHPHSFYIFFVLKDKICRKTVHLRVINKNGIEQKGKNFMWKARNKKNVW